MGGVARAMRYIEQLHKKLDPLPDDIKKTMFQVLDGQIPIDTLPESVEVEKKVKSQTVTETIKPRELASLIRRRSDYIGLMMVDRGILSEKQFAAHEGKYIHYMYAYHVLGDDAPIGVTNTGKLDLAETKRRNPDLTMDQRKALGLIEDASVAVPVGMGKAVSDLAKWDYLEKIAKNPDWVWQPSIIMLPSDKPKGKPVKMTIGKLAREFERYEEMVKIQATPEVEARLKILKDAMAKAQEESKNRPADFKLLPESRAYGPLAGAFVRQTIYDDITPILGQINADMGKALKVFLEVESKSVAVFKMGKVALNPPTAFRNTISNFIQINMSGRPFHKIPGDIVAACKSILAKDVHYEEAFGMGLFHTNWFANEVNDVLDEFRKAEGGRLDRFLIAVKNVAKYYGRIDDISKHALFLQQRKEGKSIDEAAVHALKWAMDYSLASRSVKVARRHLLPFFTYQYKIASLIAESLRDRPWVLAKYALLLPLALEWLAKSANDLDDEDLDDLKKQLPAYIKKSGSMMILPFKTDKGQYQWINLEYFLPWGNVFNMFRDMTEADIGEFTRDLGVSHPLLDLLTTVRGTREGVPPAHPFFGKPIYNELDHPALKAAKMAEHLALTFAPSALGISQGAVGYTGRALFGKEDRWGREVTPAQALGRWFGVNVLTMSPDQSAAIAAVRVQELKKELARIEADPSISEERRQASRERMQEKIADYAEDNPEAVLPITKAKGSDPVFEALLEMVKQGTLKTGPPSRTLEIGGVPSKMTIEQYREYLEQSSATARKRLAPLVTSPAWDQMTDKNKSEAVSRIVAKARKAARQRIKVEVRKAKWADAAK
jgi:hypothetical protein